MQQQNRWKRWSVGLLAGVMLTMAGAPLGGTVAAAATPTTAEEGSNSLLTGLMAAGLLGLLTSQHGDASAPVTVPSTQTAGATITAPTKTPAQTLPAPSASEAQQALQLLNADRAAAGLPALRWNQALANLGQNYAKDMIQRNFFAHNDPDGRTPFDRMKAAGISYRYAGENLAINRDVASAEKAFMNSAGHRANILNKNYTEVGIGVQRDAKGSVYVVQEFIGK